MRARALLLPLVLVGLACAAFAFFNWQFSGSWLAFGVHPEVTAHLERSLEDKKALARAYPDQAAEYREQFDAVRATLGNLRVLAHQRSELVRRYSLLVFALFGGVLTVTYVTQQARRRRQDKRLYVLQRHLEDLATGTVDIRIGDQKTDTIGRIARMIESTSRRMAGDQQRLAALEHLAAWQETARRHAHELRTPLTAARLEIGRLANLADRRAPVDQLDLTARVHSVVEELDRLARFAQHFASFARLPQPRLVIENLGLLLEGFVSGFGAAWPNLRLTLELIDGSVACPVDREMLRQVLTNLCENSSRALAERRGQVAIRLARANGRAVIDVSDDGPGLAAAVRKRLFEPYVTTRARGEGMGLGLAISKKIVLDQGGDLTLLASSVVGTTFRIVLPIPPVSAR